MACFGFGKTLFAVCGVSTYILLPVPSRASFDCNCPRSLLFFPCNIGTPVPKVVLAVCIFVQCLLSSLRDSVVKVGFRFTIESPHRSPGFDSGSNRSEYLGCLPVVKAAGA